jgi:hypothetical protein
MLVLEANLKNQFVITPDQSTERWKQYLDYRKRFYIKMKKSK